MGCCVWPGAAEDTTSLQRRSTEFSGTLITDPSLFASLEASLQRLTRAGFRFEDSLASLTVLYSFTIGFVIEEQAVHPKPDENNPAYDPERRAGLVDKTLYPLAYAAGPPTSGGAETRFREGLAIIIQGMAARLSRQ
jgi:TetR/AcrR family tetracycline transcriptional repressor